jgi:ketosteroid isomerase-like protein
MKNVFQYLILFSLLVSSCETETKTDSIEKWKQEIQQAEQDFADMAAEKGIHDAFINFAAEDAVLKRGDLIIGKAAIDKHLERSTSKSLSWTPDYVDVSSSGDLGYTYGKYVYKYTDSIGNPLEDKGVFHTVWKRQANGSWKFVWD